MFVLYKVNVRVFVYSYVYLYILFTYVLTTCIGRHASGVNVCVCMYCE